jgi:hypothetical protein
MINTLKQVQVLSITLLCILECSFGKRAIALLHKPILQLLPYVRFDLSIRLC